MCIEHVTYLFWIHSSQAGLISLINLTPCGDSDRIRSVVEL